MIIFIFIVYLALVWIIFEKLKLAKLDLKAKIEVVGIGLIICATILFALAVVSPYSTNLMVYQYIVQIAPKVAGRVVEVPILPNVPIKKGQVLFRIDPERYQIEVNLLKAALAEAEQSVPQLKAVVEGAKATLERSKAAVHLARIQHERTLSLVGAAALQKEQKDRAIADLQSAEATVSEAQAKLEQARLAYESEISGQHTRVAKAKAELAIAELNLKETIVYAPSDGFVINLQLRPGSMVGGPSMPVMSFVETSESLLVALIKQNALSHVLPGNSAELALDMYPGRIIKAEVETVIWGGGQGQLSPSGDLPKFFNQQPRGLFAVRLKVIDQPPYLRLPAGAGGTAAIYTDVGTTLHTARRVMIRMQTWLNYLFLS
jgi:multidrug resistance efflux pump